MIGVVDNNRNVTLKFENGSEFNTVLLSDYQKRAINSYFIKNDMEFGVIYIAVTGKNEYFITKIQNKKNEIVIKLKSEELKNGKRPIISVG